MVGTTRYNVQLRGSGDRAMVFAPGFGCDQRIWNHVAPHFETEFVTVLFDHVGSGRSDISRYSAEKYASLGDYARDVVELGREVRLEDAVFVGHSCGAMIGMLASIQAPRMFESLVLVSASPCYLDDASYVGGFTQAQIDALIRELRHDYAGWCEHMAPVLMGNRDRPQLTQELLRSLRESDPTIAAEFGSAIFCSDWRSELSEVSAECLLVQCEQDPIVPASVGRYLNRHISNCRLETIATDGHFPPVSAPDRLVEKIRQFVGHDAAGQRNGRHPRIARGVQRWLTIQGADIRDSVGSGWRPRPPTPEAHMSEAHMREAEGRAQLEELLLMRVGELSAHLGRYDMYALALASWLYDGHPAAPRPPHHASLQPPLNVRTRGAAIKALMVRRQIPDSAIAQFDAIDAELRAVLDRHEIAARNCAVVPSFGFARSPTVAPRDWYDYESASDEELLSFIDAIERDAVKVASLCIRLADIAAFGGSGQT